MRLKLSDFEPPPARPVSDAPQVPTLRLKSPKTMIREAARLASIASALGEPQRDTTIHLVSMADWSTHNVLAYLLERIGPAELHLATWSVGEDAFRSLLNLREKGSIRRIVCVFDWRVKVRNPKVFQLVRSTSDVVAVQPCHAKVFVLRNASWAYTYTGSANLTNNPHIEAQILAEDRALADFHAGWIDDLAHKRARFAALADPPELELATPGRDDD